MHSMFYAVARCPSHAGIVSKRLIIHILKVFSLSGSPTILVFPYQIGGNIPTGTTLTGESNAKGVWKNHDFLPVSRFISEMMQDRAMLTMEGE